MTSTIIESMRISESNLQVIRATFKDCFEPGDHLWVFGSRVNDTLRGGDMDFYIETHKTTAEALDSKTRFVNALWRTLGDQKIDVVLNIVSLPALPVHNIAKTTGVLIV
jgi:hypothetical protein